MSPDPKLADGIARATAVRYGALSTSKELPLLRPRPRRGRAAARARTSWTSAAAGEATWSVPRAGSGPRGSATGVDASERMLAAAAGGPGRARPTHGW